MNHLFRVRVTDDPHPYNFPEGLVGDSYSSRFSNFWMRSKDIFDLDREKILEEVS